MGISLPSSQDRGLSQAPVAVYLLYPGGPRCHLCPPGQLQDTDDIVLITDEQTGKPGSFHCLRRLAGCTEGWNLGRDEKQYW